MLALAYVACNLGLNISALALLRRAGEIPSIKSSITEVNEQQPDFMGIKPCAKDDKVPQRLMSVCEGTYISCLAERSRHSLAANRMP